MYENLITSSFNIKSILENNSKKEYVLINKEIYNLAEKIVKNKVINQKGSVAESQKYNEIILSEIDRALDIMDNFSQYTKISIKKETSRPKFYTM